MHRKTLIHGRLLRKLAHPIREASTAYLLGLVSLAMAHRDFVFKIGGYKKSTGLQFREKSRKIIYKSQRIRSFQNSESSRHREISPQRNGSPHPLIDKDKVGLDNFRKQDGLPFAAMQRCRERNQR